MHAATDGGTRPAQSPSLYIRLRTSVPLSSSRSTIGRETTGIPRSLNSLITRGEFVYTASNFGTRERTWPTQTLWTWVSGIGMMWYRRIPSSSRARWIISNRSAAVNGFSPVWLYCADPIPMISSSCFARIRFAIARWPLWNGWKRPMNRARLSVIVVLTDELVQVLAFQGEVLPAVDAPGVVHLRIQGGVKLEAGIADEVVVGRLVLHAHTLRLVWGRARNAGPGHPRERRRLRHDRGELRDEALLLRPADEGVLEDLLQVLHGDDLDLPDVPVLQEDVLHVRLRDQDLQDPHLRGGLDLRRDAADREDLPPDAEGPRHRDALVHLNALQGANHGGGDGDRRAVPLRALPAPDELDVDVVVRHVLARVLLDQRGDVLDGLLRDVPNPARRADLPAPLHLGRGHLRRDREDDPAELGHRGVPAVHRESVHDARDGALRDERLVLLPALDDPVRDLLLEGPCDPLPANDVGRGHEGRALLLGDVPRHADEPAKLAEPEGEL